MLRNVGDQVLKTIKVIIIIFFALTIISGCTNNLDTESSQEFIKIAAVYPVNQIDNNTTFWNGIELAVKEINQNGGINNRELVVEKHNDSASVTEGLRIAETLSKDREIKAVIGHWNSSVTLAAAAIYEENKKIMITPASTSPQITQQGYKYIFQHITDDQKFAEMMAELALKKDYNRIAVYYADDEYGFELSNYFIQSAENRKINIIDRISIIDDRDQVIRFLEKWKALDADAIFIADVLSERGSTFSLFAEGDIDLPIISVTGFNRKNYLKDYSHYIPASYLSTSFNPYTNNNSHNFLNSYKSEYNDIPDMWGAHAYEIIEIITEVLKKSDLNSAADITAALKNISNFKGVTGDLNYSQSGELEGQDIYIKTIEKDKNFYIINSETVGGIYNE
ncbi:MAG: ABC transporter substrate-binding protein [Bacillota bacterium]